MQTAGVETAPADALSRVIGSIFFGWSTAMSITFDPTDVRLKKSNDTEPTDMAEAYLVLDEDERKKAFTRPYRDTYLHTSCGAMTKMGYQIAETMARDPHFYGGTYCTQCHMHRPLSEFTWEDGSKVGS